MADGLDLSELLRRTVQANARFYKGWVDLSLEYFRGIAEIFGGETLSAGEPVVEEAETGAGALVLEGEEGVRAAGAFLVTNDLGRKLDCELVATPLRDADGNVARAKPVFDPARLEIAPGEQRVVRASLPIDASLAPGVAYMGAISIKGMDGFSVPMVVRRRHGTPASPIDRIADEESAGPAPKTTSGRAAARKSTRKKAAKKKSPRKKK